jgi:hypothetical protein
MNTSIKIGLVSAVGILAPFVVFAKGPTLFDIITLIIKYLNVALVLFMGAAVVIFVYHVIKYFILPNADRSEAGSYVLYSVIGFFVILSFWGLVNVLQNTFGLQNENHKPSSWASFSNLFPGGGSSSGGNTFNGSGMRAPANPNSGGFVPASDLQIQGGIQKAQDLERLQREQGQI